MQQSSPSNHHAPKPLLRRLDRVFGEMNAVLLAIGIGLATLDATCYLALSLRDALPTGQMASTIEEAWRQ